MDFYVLQISINPTMSIVTAKRPINGNEVTTLESLLKEQGVDDMGIGITIEQLESLPYGAGQAEITGRNGRIVIKQVA